MSGQDFGAAWSAAFRRGSDAELRGWLEVAQAACDETDGIARRYFRRDLTIDTKPDRTFVTIADTEVETHIRSRIADAFPDHGIIGEEFGTEGASASVRAAPNVTRRPFSVIRENASCAPATGVPS